VPYVLQVDSRFRAKQGLLSPVRAGAGLPSLDEADGRPFVVRAGLTFVEEAINDTTGRAVDSDLILLRLQDATRSASTQPWTELFNFRPTLERMARHFYEFLAESLDGLAYVEVHDTTAGLTVRYQP